MHTGGKGLQCAEGPERSARDLIGVQWSMLFKASAAGCETTCCGMVWQLQAKRSPLMSLRPANPGPKLGDHVKLLHGQA